MAVSIILLLLICTSFTLSILSECKSDNGIICECILENSEIKVRNCIRPGGWSTWSKWSKCREGTRKRRRTCNNPLPIGSTCTGSKAEKQSCVVSNIPEFLFGEWTSWNSWSRCDCDSSLRSRTRHCKGSSCEGCDKQYESCEPGECPVNKKWSQWTEWTDYGTEKIRYSAWCSSSSNVANLDVGFRKESQESTRSANWSEWSMHPGVTYRYRVLRNSSIFIEHHLLSRSTSACLPLHFTIPLLCFCILIGFLLQNIILYVVHCCQKKFSRLTYSCDSYPHNYPSHLIRSPIDESFW